MAPYNPKEDKIQRSVYTPKDVPIQGEDYRNARYWLGDQLAKHVRALIVCGDNDGSWVLSITTNAGIKYACQSSNDHLALLAEARKLSDMLCVPLVY